MPAESAGSRAFQSVRFPVADVDAEDIGGNFSATDYEQVAAIGGPASRCFFRLHARDQAGIASGDGIKIKFAIGAGAGD